MLSIISVWTGLLALLMSTAMLIRRSLFTSIWLTISMYTAIFSLTLAGVALWGLRKEYSREHGVAGQRSQCYIGIGLSGIAIAIMYGLVLHTSE